MRECLENNSAQQPAHKGRRLTVSFKMTKEEEAESTRGQTGGLSHCKGKSLMLSEAPAEEATVEKEDRNKRAPLLSQGLSSLNYSCPPLISALIMSLTRLEDGKGRVAADLWVPTAQLSSADSVSLQEPPGSHRPAPPRSQNVCSCPDHAARTQ